MLVIYSLQYDRLTYCEVRVNALIQFYILDARIVLDRLESEDVLGMLKCKISFVA